ncbi:MAG: prolipoprotein diacylglyceryl transferase [Patescibacteria group bacterium]
MLDLIYNFYPSRVLFDFGIIKIYWYGLFIFIALLVSFFTYYLLSKKQNVEKKYIFDSFFWSVLFGLIGARLFYVLYYFSYYLKNPVEIFFVWDGGLAILGGFVSGFIALFIYCKIKKIDILKTLNTVSVALIIGQIIGRIGNYFNQELFGLPTNFFLKIPISLENRPVGYEGYTFFMPLFLYEILFNLIILFILFLYYKRFFKNNLNQGMMIKNVNVKTFRANMEKLTFIEKGGIFFIYINFYCLLRFVLEFFRLGENKFYGISYNQIVITVILLIFNGIWFFKIRRKK